MKRLITPIFLCFGLLFSMCENQNDNAFDISKIKGNDYVFRIDRVLNKTDIQYPSEELEESDYKATIEEKKYAVTFSTDGEGVVIEPGSIKGALRGYDTSSEKIYYDLEEGVFAGGRFVVWDNNSFQAELTIYGSGVAVINSERGVLE